MENKDFPFEVPESVKSLMKNVPTEKVTFKTMPKVPEGYCPMCKMNNDILVKCDIIYENRLVLTFATGEWREIENASCYRCPNKKKCGWCVMMKD